MELNGTIDKLETSNASRLETKFEKLIQLALGLGQYPDRIKELGFVLIISIKKRLPRPRKNPEKYNSSTNQHFELNKNIH